MTPCVPIDLIGVLCAADRSFFVAATARIG
jgi:hypothetical protein